MKIRTLSTAIVLSLSLVLLTCLSPVLAQSEQPASLKNVTLSIYPEYDDPLQLGYPAVLVMFEGEVTNLDIPGEIRFLVPADAVMYSAGSGPRSQYVGGPPDRKPSDITGWDEISYELKTNYFVVEYYAPIIDRPDRVIQYDFRPLYSINGLTAVIQEPKRSTDFTVSPLGSTGTDGEGFRIHTYSYANVSPDAPLHFDISYTKTDSRPSLSDNGGTGSQSTTIIILVIVIIAILIGAFFLVSSSRSKTRTATRAQRRQATRAVQSKTASKARYCSNCGKGVNPSDRFCRYCGNELD